MTSDDPLVASGAGERRRSRLGPAATGLLAVLLVALPWLRSGVLLVLDWVHGPNAALPASSYGFGGVLASVPMGLVDHLVSQAIGYSADAIVWIVAVFVVAAAAMADVVPGGKMARYGAALLYALNPILFEHLGAGQVYYLLGYALLPLAARSILRGERQRGWRRLGPAIWITALMAISIHFVFICGVLLVAVVVWRHRLTTVGWALAVLAAVVLLNLYILLPAVGGQLGISAQHAGLSAYRTSGDRTWGLFVNVLGLYGFWRQGPVLPKNYVTAWPILLLVIVAVAVVGGRRAWRDGHRELVGVLGLSAIAGYFLALGTQGPTGGLFHLLYQYLPGFKVMREPQKFSVLLALAYAVGFGLGAEELVTQLSARRSQVVAGAVALALPLLYTPTIFYGLGGQIHTSRYPASWFAANRLMGSGSGKILFLPWHLYLAFPFTHGQVIANPAPAFFSRPVISGDNVQVGNIQTDSTSKRSAYLAQLYADGPNLHEFGHLVAQLGVRYVVLSHTVDYASYSWLYHQSDLVPVFRQPNLTVWRNAAALPQGARLTATLTVPSVASYVTLAQHEDLVGTAVFLRRGAPVPSPSTEPQPIDDVRQRSQVSYSVAAGPPGWAVIPENADPAWRSGGQPSKALVDGVVGVRVTGRATSVYFSTWTKVKIGYAISGGTLVLLVGGMLFSWRRGTRGSSGGGAATENDGIEAEGVGS